MIDKVAAAEVVELYNKHGWLLRRVLLVPDSDNALGDLIGEVPVIPSIIDAAWFSRPPKSGPISWEIRFFGEPPFSLLESLDENDADFEANLKAVEERLYEKISAGNIRLTTAASNRKL